MFISTKFSTLSAQGYLRVPPDWNSADHDDLVFIPHWDVAQGMVIAPKGHQYVVDNKGWMHPKPRFNGARLFIPKDLRGHFANSGAAIACAGMGDRIEIMPRDIHAARGVYFATLLPQAKMLLKPVIVRLEDPSQNL